MVIIFWKTLKASLKTELFFVTDALDNKKMFRAFTIIDDFNRDALHIEVDFSLPSNRIIWVLNHLINRRTKPHKIRMGFLASYGNFHFAIFLNIYLFFKHFIFSKFK